MIDIQDETTNGEEQITPANDSWMIVFLNEGFGNM